MVASSQYNVAMFSTLLCNFPFASFLHFAFQFCASFVSLNPWADLNSISGRLLLLEFAENCQLSSALKGLLSGLIAQLSMLRDSMQSFDRYKVRTHHVFPLKWDVALQVT